MAKLVFLAAFLFFQAATASCPQSLIEEAWNLVDHAELSAYLNLFKDDLIDGASYANLYSLGASFAAISEVSWVRPGSACAYSSLIEASLGHGDLRSAIDGFAVVLAQGVENFRILGTNCVLPSPWPVLDNSCGDYGRIYSFEESWDHAKGFNTNKFRCSARDLYTSFGAKLNNVGAAATASATESALAIYRSIEHDLINFLNVVVAPGGCGTKDKSLRTQAGILKAAIFKAAAAAQSSCH